VRRIPLVVTGTGPLADRFSALVRELADDIAGREGFVLDIASELGPEPSVLVDTVPDGGLEALLLAVRGGHAAVTADLAGLVRHPADFAVLRADRRLGLAGALLPGLPLAETLARHRDAGDVVAQVEIDGSTPAGLVDEAVTVAALLGQELERQHVRLDGDPGDRGRRWRAVVGSRFPTVCSADGPPPGEVRTAVVRTERSGPAGVTLRGPVGGDDRTAAALLGDVLAFAREQDTPWRAHRRRAWCP
jgi:hypothetical protein